MIMTLLKLFISFFQVGLFGIGGGYAAMPLIQDQVINLHHWLDMQAFTDVVTISQMTPGPIAINASTFVGIQVQGVPGALIATLGCVLPSFIIVLILAYIYFKYKELSFIQNLLAGLRPAVVALIASAGVSILLMALFQTQKLPKNFDTFDIKACVIFAASLFVLRKYKADPIKVMCAGGAVGALVYYVL